MDFVTMAEDILMRNIYVPVFGQPDLTSPAGVRRNGLFLLLLGVVTMPIIPLVFWVLIHFEMQKTALVGWTAIAFMAVPFLSFFNGLDRLLSGKIWTSRSRKPWPLMITWSSLSILIILAGFFAWAYGMFYFGAYQPRLIREKQRRLDFEREQAEFRKQWNLPPLDASAATKLPATTTLPVQTDPFWAMVQKDHEDQRIAMEETWPRRLALLLGGIVALTLAYSALTLMYARLGWLEPRADEWNPREYHDYE